MTPNEGSVLAFWTGVRMAIVGHIATWLTTRSLEQLWHLVGHVATGVALYIIEKLIH